MNARDLMTRNPLVVTPGQPLEDAARVMRDLDVGAVPVVDDPREPRLLGVITDRDMAVRCLAAGHAGECTVGEHMTAAPLHTVSPTADADEVMEMMKGCQVRRVLVTDNPPGLHRAIYEPPLVLGRREVSGRIMDAPYPLADLDQGGVRIHPGGPGITAADHLAGQVAEHLAPLLIEAQYPGNAVNAGLLQVPQQGVYRRRPGRGLLVDDATDQHGAVHVATRQGLLAHGCCIPVPRQQRQRI